VDVTKSCRSRWKQINLSNLAAREQYALINGLNEKKYMAAHKIGHTKIYLSSFSKFSLKNN
jgi:hypothetical protein